ncbi:MAG: ABC transporter permease [Chloroflexi bacterium]|nr:ABC transporter permease [Chloroflexota bacterium]
MANVELELKQTVVDRPFLVEYRTPLVAAVGVITGLLALLVFGAGIESLTGVLQFWLVLVVIGVLVVTLSSNTVRVARRWHGTDWWLAVLSAVFLTMFIIIGIIPEYLAPYSADEEIGPGLLAPGEVPSNYIWITRTDLPYEDITDVAIDPVTGEAIDRPSNAKSVGGVDEQASRLVGQLRDNDGVLLDVNRDVPGSTPSEALDLLSTSDLEGRRPLVAVVGREEDFTELVGEYDNLRIVGPVGPTFDSGFLLGTNKLGQDVFSRLLFGARTTLLISITAALFSSLIGIPLGLISGYVGGALDRMLAPLMDSLYSFPGLILAIAIASALGRGIFTVIGAIGVIYIPTYYRIVRSQTLSVKEAAYVEAGRSLGANNRTLLARYVFPNVFASVVVLFSINIADAILTGAGLAFLSLGLPETIPDWGVDLVKGQEFVLGGQWWLVIFPGFAIAFLTLCFSMLGESLSEILNPRLNRT